MQIDRTTIITGPALVTFGGQTFWSKGDITLKPVVDKFAIETSAFGEVDGRIRDKRFEVTFEPEGRFTTALLAVLYPYAATNIGASIYGSSDRALVIHSRAGTRITVHNASLTSLPALRFAVGSTITGSVTFTGLCKKDTAPSSAAAYWTVATATYPGDTGFSTSTILTRGYTSTWLRPGTTDLTIPTREGWEIAFDLTLEPVIVDGIGTVDMRLSELKVKASCIPVGLTESDILTSMQHAQVMGSSIQDSQALEIEAEGGGAFFSMPNVALVEADLGWGAQRNRTGTCTWEAVRRIVSAVPEPLYYIGEDAPA